MFLSIRKDEVRRLLRNLSHSEHKKKVELRPLLTELTFNNIMRMVSGKRYYGHDVTDDAEAKRFRELIPQITENSVSSHEADYLPFLTWFGYGNYETKLLRLGKEMDLFLQGLIQDHRSQASQNTMIDHLLSLQKSQPEHYSDQMIKALVLVMLVAGTDTSAGTLEWAMSSLLNHPDILKKASAELDTRIGHRQLVDESDLPKLPYLQSIISETLRLYPGTPLLLPHMSSAVCPIGDFNMPRDTMLLANAWAIHREPTSWEDPLTFKPERFQNGEPEAHKFMPFGMGRRACPGACLAQRIMGLALGSLIQCFEWEKAVDEEIDITEATGLTLSKAVPLEAMCKPRPVTKDILSKITLEG